MLAGRPATGRPAAAKLEYTTLPAPCTMLAPGTVAKFLPGASASPAQAAPAGVSKAGACTWSSTAGNEDRTLILQVTIYGSATGTSLAQHAYARGMPSGNCRCRGYTVTRQAVAGLGDQATVLFTTAGPRGGGASWTAPTANMLVRSGNATVNVEYTVAGMGLSKAPDEASLRAATAQLARDVLAALSRAA